MNSRTPLAWAFALFLCVPCRAADPAVLADCRNALPQLSPAVSALRTGAYSPKDHAAASSTLKLLSQRLAAQRLEPGVLVELQRAVAEAQVAESPFWAGLSAEHKLGRLRIPAQQAAALLPRLEAVTAALNKLAPGPQPDAWPAAGDAAPAALPQADLKGAAAVTEPKRWNAAVDGAKTALFWDRNTASGDVGKRPGLVSSPLPGQAPPPRRIRTTASLLPKGLFVKDVPSLGEGEQAEPPMPCQEVLAEHPKIAQMCQAHPTLAPLIGGVLDAFKAQFGTIQGIVTSLLYLILGLAMSALSGFGLVAKVAVSLASLGMLAATLGPLVKKGWDASRDLIKSAAGSLQQAGALLRLGQVGGTVLILALMSAIGWGVGKTKPGQAALSSMQGAMSQTLSKLGVAKGAAALDARLPGSVKTALERSFGPAQTAQTAPAKGELTGDPAHINSAETPSNKLALQRQNDSARLLADNGYKVHQNGLAAGPDYILNGVGHDCYSPTSPNPRNIWTTISGKVYKHQAQSFVINLDGSPVELGALQAQFVQNPIPTLGDILVVRGGKITPLMKAGQAAALSAR